MTQPSIEGVGHGMPRMLFASDGSKWYAILVDSDGHVKIDVVTTALPTGAATAANQAIIAGYIDALETLLAGGLPAALDTGALKTKEQSPLTGFATSANQATMITALQLIDDLRNALGSVDTDDLQVDVKTYPGSNALGNFPFGYNDTVLEAAEVAGTGGNPIAYGTAVPTGEVWVITSIEAHHSDTTARKMLLHIDRGGTVYVIDWSAALAQWVALSKQGQWVLKAADKIGCRFDSLATGKTGYLYINGYKMKVA